MLPDLGLAAAGSGDLRVVVLDLDINEPAVISPVLRALRKIAGPAAAEVRRVVVGTGRDPRAQPAGAARAASPP